MRQQQNTVNHTLMTLAGAGIGAGLMYLLDPDRGARRRALVRDKLAHTANVTEEALETTWRDTRNRAQGWIASARSALTREQVADVVLAERVRAELGYLVRHPSSIEVCADQGTVILSGPILSDEVDRLLGWTKRIRGVKNIVNRLEVHADPGNVPGLQGDPPGPRQGRRVEWLQASWAPTARMAAGGAGASLAWYGASRRDLQGMSFLLLGVALLGRAITNMEFKRLVGMGAGRRAVDLTKTITIAAPIDQVFQFWSDYESFPQYLSRVREVRKTGDNRSRWTVVGPARTPLHWTAVITQFVPRELIAWKTEPHARIQHAGIVRFTENRNDTTTVHMQMTYNPPAGAVGYSLAALLGADPKTLLDEELVRMKTTLETGAVPRDAQQRTRETVEPAEGKRAG